MYSNDLINRVKVLPCLLNIYHGVVLSTRPLVKCRLRTCGPDLRTGKWLGLVFGFILRVRVRVRVSVMVKVRVSSSILPCCWSAVRN